MVNWERDMLRICAVFLILFVSGCGQKEASQPPVVQKALKKDVSRVSFTRYIDRTEGAFIVLVPSGWTVSGGILRVNPLTAAGGVGNAMEAKVDFAVLRDPSGQAAIRWLPKMNYLVPNPGTSMLGGNWNGMQVMNMPSAADFLTRMLFPWLRPQAQNMKVVETQKRPDIEASVRQLPLAQSMLSQGIYYVADAATVTLSYEENGVRFREILFVALEGYSAMGSGFWQNSFTITARAPEEEYKACGPIAKTVVNSFSINPVWLRAEMQGQAQRSNIVQNTLNDLSRIDAEIAQSRAQTMEAINHEEYLTLTGQEVYVNPQTGREELGSNEWKYRWADNGGGVIYTDDSDWNPNNDPELKVSGFERTPVKPR